MFGQTRRTRFMMGALIPLALIIAIYAVDTFRQRTFEQVERAEAGEFLADLQAHMTMSLVDHELRARGLATALELNTDIDQSEFARLAARFAMEDSSIVNLAAIEGSIIRYVHPYDENRDLVGRDVGEMEAQREVLERLGRTRETEIQGPLPLLQERLGIILRMPVGLPDIESFVSVAVVLDANAVFEEALSMTETRNGSRGYDAILASANLAHVVGDKDLIGADPLTDRWRMHNMNVLIGVKPKGGWGAAYQVPWLLYSGLFILFGSAIGLVLILRKHKQDSISAQVHLKTAIDSLADGFVLLDADNRVILSNHQYAQMHDKCADAIKPGAKFEDILRLGIERGQFPDAIGQEEEWLARQLKKPPKEGHDFTIAFDDGRWIRIYEKLTPQGGRVGLRIDVTRQVEVHRRAEAAESLAKEAKDQLMMAIETLPDGFALFDADDHLVLCNDRYKEIYHKSAEVMTPGTTFEEILRFGLERGQFPDAIGREHAWLAERMAAHRAANTTIEQALDNGRYLRILERATPSGGRVGLRIDITEQIESRLRAEKAERRLRDAINALPAGFWLFGSDGKLEMFNETYCKLYEKTAPAVKIGATSREMLEYGLEHGEYPEAVGREEEWLQELSERLAGPEYEWEYPLANGRWVRSINQPISDGSRVGIRVDITELKEKEAALKASNNQLRAALGERDAATQRFMDVAKISDDWFWEQDKDLRFTFVSEGFDRLMGKSSQHMIGKTRLEVYGTLPKTMESADWDWLAAKLEAREPFREFVYRASGTKSDSVWIRVTGAPIFDENGEFAGYRGVGTDISDLYNAVRDAEAASVAKTEFLNVMSHELRTPLTVILGYNAFLAKPDLLASVSALETKTQDGTLTPDTASEHLAAIKSEVSGYAVRMKESGKHLLELINEMLDLAKIDAGKLDMEPTEIALDDMVASVANQFSQAAEQKSLELRLDTHGERVIADELRLRQILINLVGNALKFTDDGNITIHAKAEGEDVAILVSDTGCGIAPESQQVIFEQFRQADSSVTRKKGGTGLGLTISRRLVELQGGQLSIESEVEKGSTFRFTLPAASKANSPKTSAKASQAA